MRRPKIIHASDTFREILELLDFKQRAELFDSAIQAISESQPKTADELRQLDKLLDNWGPLLDDGYHFQQLRIRLLYDVIGYAGRDPIGQVLRETNKKTESEWNKKRITQLLDMLQVHEYGRLHF